MTFKVEGLPSSIRVAAYDIAVEVRSHQWAEGCVHWREFSGAEQRLSIVETAPSATHAADTVLHEVLHAVWWAYKINDHDPQERTV